MSHQNLTEAAPTDTHQAWKLKDHDYTCRDGLTMWFTVIEQGSEHVRITVAKDFWCYNLWWCYQPLTLGFHQLIQRQVKELQTCHLIIVYLHGRDDEEPWGIFFGFTSLIQSEEGIGRVRRDSSALYILLIQDLSLKRKGSEDA